MAEESTTPEEQVVEQTPQLSQVEQKAQDQGWVPKDQWEGDPDEWRPAKEFVDRGELFKKIDEVKRENKNLRQGLDELSKHHARVREVEYKRALDALKAQKKEALAEGDVDAVVEIDERMDEVKETQRQAQVTPRQVDTQPDPVFTDWTKRNSWYNSDNSMRVVADDIARQQYLRGNTNRTEILDAVDKEIKKAFPHKFTNPNREKGGAVEGSTGRTTPKRETVELNDAERQIMNKILRVTPGLTKEKYLEEFKATKGRGA